MKTLNMFIPEFDELSDALCKAYNNHGGLPRSILDLREDIFKEVLEPVVNQAGYEFCRDEVLRIMLY